MVRKFALGALGAAVVLLGACSGSSEDGAAGSGGTSDSGAAGHDASSGGATSTGGRAGSGGATSSGGGTSSGGATGSGGASGTGASAGGNVGGAAGSITDADADVLPEDAGSDVTPAPVCLGSNEACGDETGTCCEAYVCRLGKCCVPTGIWSNCLTNSDCCSNSCILRQCTCVPQGYTCTGPGQCCGGFSCVNGTCICPPDIRGCK
jgi:hypothetical protein